ncbi:MULTISPECIES: SOS response-associated peptidase family protein [unclassified Pseudomonas]|uniref:SOS response-associated peptidase family protein n=1 Tax=unclassified Pseudomonas TaxID=196821 RepID=UPI000A09FB9E|nr:MULTISPECIES: SOS response-associated peptidase family protein [unclassified Pseudomonas]SMF35894.1 Putative SOS response-associated peptidase YedK [Pseudomonas sp. LAIL14HWK12:I11]SMR79011.1 Putative SOS response-associated peptidase YedK [Pseudomonas sp. LAIL14HWK12:I10]SOD04769.1 Putative SOS response-associated peptidase YedK [Pseudomonas sp. LAIL14HWK12:I8]
MCGRYSIYESMDHYLRQLSLDLVVINGYDHEPISRYNVAPSTRVEVIRQLDGGLRVDRVKWGWSPFWAKGKRPDPINARAETVSRGKFFKSLWPHGRALAPANGWFEWVPDLSDPKRKRPFYITSDDGAPLYFAALAEVNLDIQQDGSDGFVIITAAADQGLIDIHDRKPLVLPPELAREWIAPTTSQERAAEIVEQGCTPADEFRWYPVGKAVGNVRNEGESLITPINDENHQGQLKF